MENVSMLDIAKSLVEKFYQLDLKISSNQSSLVEKECGYKSMSTIKYAEGFNDGKENLYQHSVEFANELLAKETLIYDDIQRIKATCKIVR